MANVKVNCNIETYPDDSTSAKKELVGVKSHWNCSDRVNIKVGSKEVTVVGEDLIIAVRNCMNVR